MQNIRWGIDLGGTKIEGVVLANDEGKVLARKRLPTEQTKGYEHIVGQIKAVVNLLQSATGLQPQHIGIGTPGAVDPDTGLHKNSNTTILNGRPFRADVQRALGVPITMANDANCFAVAETRMGVVHELFPHARLVFGVIMGTGVGGGLVFDGQVWNGRQGIGGEWGHSFLDASGGLCYCGNVGCVETIFSGPALERYYLAQSGTAQRMPTILTQYQAGDNAAAAATIERLLHFFGKGIANIINILDPDAIVLGGGLGNIDLLYTEGLERVKQHVFNTGLHTPILKPTLGDSAGVFGAAFL